MRKDRPSVELNIHLIRRKLLIYYKRRRVGYTTDYESH